jgi:hypothetical protein
MNCCNDDMVMVTDCSGTRVVVCVWCEHVDPFRIRVFPPRYSAGKRPGTNNTGSR